jgi:hypothetical protein
MTDARALHTIKTTKNKEVGSLSTTCTQIGVEQENMLLTLQSEYRASGQPSASVLPFVLYAQVERRLPVQASVKGST